jgi:flagellar assembly protein FliH
MSKLISREETQEFRRWDLPIVEDVSAAVNNAKHGKSPGLMTAEQIERIQKQAYKEAYDAGYKKGQQEGLRSGQTESDYKIHLLGDLLESLAHPFEDLDDVVEQQLVSLSLAIARQLVRRELKADPEQVIGVVHEALAALPVASRDVKVCLHPDDGVLVREMMTQTESDRNWLLVNDPGLTRGDCRILTEVSQVEATLEKRLAAVVSQLFGGERERDSRSLSESSDASRDV